MLGYFLMGRERLKSYSVHEKPDPAADRVLRADELEFVRDGFDVSAFLAPPVWLTMRRIWLGLLVYAGAVAIIVFTARAMGVAPFWPMILVGAVHLLFGLEADELQRHSLSSKGWQTVGHVTGTGALDCERRFLDQWLPGMPVTRTVLSPGQSSVQATTAPRLASVPLAGKRRLSSVLGNVFAPPKRG